jgi:hypothetical protein
MRFLEEIFGAIGAMAVLGGCAAMLATPVTSPVWMVIGVLFLVHRAFRPIWWLSTWLHLILFSLFAFLGFTFVIGCLIWGDINAIPSWYVELFVLGMVSTVLTLVSLRLSVSNDDRGVRRLVCVALQILATLAAWIPLISLVRSGE